MSQSPDTWRCWRDKYGTEQALDEYFPELLKTNPLLSAAKIQIEIAKLAIDAEMKRLAEDEGVFE